MLFAPLHEPVARSMLSRGIEGLLLEKPIACDADTASALLDDVKTLGIPMVVPHGMLALPAPNEIERRVRSGDIGEVIAVDVQNSVDLLNGWFTCSICSARTGRRPWSRNSILRISL